MKKADVYLEMICHCPECGEQQEVEWCEETEGEYYEWQCDKCENKFKYCHPCNNYDL